MAHSTRLIGLAKFLGVSVQALETFGRNLRRRRRPARFAFRRKGWTKHVFTAQKAPQPAAQLLTVAVDTATLDENALYADWQKASDEEKSRLEFPLYSAIREHAKSLILKSLGKDDPDLEHEIGVAAISGLSNFLGKSKFSTWVQRIALNKINQELRTRERHRKVFAESDDAHEPISNDTQEHLDEQFRLAALTKGLTSDELTLLDGELHGMSRREVAETLGITVNAAESRWRRLKDKLRKKSESLDGK